MIFSDMRSESILRIPPFRLCLTDRSWLDRALNLVASIKLFIAPGERSFSPLEGSSEFCLVGLCGCDGSTMAGWMYRSRAGIFNFSSTSSRALSSFTMTSRMLLLPAISRRSKNSLGVDQESLTSHRHPRSSTTSSRSDTASQGGDISSSWTSHVRLSRTSLSTFDK